MLQPVVPAMSTKVASAMPATREQDRLVRIRRTTSPQRELGGWGQNPAPVFLLQDVRHRHSTRRFPEVPMCPDPGAWSNSSALLRSMASPRMHRRVREHWARSAFVVVALLWSAIRQHAPRPALQDVTVHQPCPPPALPLRLTPPHLGHPQKGQNAYSRPCILPTRGHTSGGYHWA